MAAFIPNDTFRELRRKKGSRQQLATLLETSTANIVRWERGETRPEPAMLQRLCELFEMSPEELGFPKIVLSQREEAVQQAIGSETSTQGQTPTQGRLLRQGFSSIYDSAIPLLPAAPLVGRTRELFQVTERLKRSTNCVVTVLT